MNDIIDMRRTIAPKSDQLNADDLLGRSLTIKITRVVLNESADQPVSIYFEGDSGKPYKPCKTMRRVLVGVWGDDGKSYVGKSMTLYCDPKVRFGGVDVGGIRISHVSGIQREMTMALTATRGNKKPYVVRQLAAHEAQKTAVSAPALSPELETEAREAAKRGSVALESLWDRLDNKQKKSLLPIMEELKAGAMQADQQETHEPERPQEDEQMNPLWAG